MNSEIISSSTKSTLLVNAGNVATAASAAAQLRLDITQDERPKVLDYIGERQMVAITIDVVEDAIDQQLGWDRFIEP